MSEMSYSSFISFIAGLVFSGALLMTRLWVVRRKGIVESDEMTKLIVTRATSSSFWGIGILTMLAWIIDNTLRNQRGEGVQFYSPWGIIFFATIFFYLISFLYHRWVITGELVEREKVRKKQAAFILIGVGALLIPVMLHNSPGASAIKPLVISLWIISLVQGVILLITSKQVG